jgi:hypothetical protein
LNYFKLLLSKLFQLDAILQSSILPKKMNECFIE